MQRQLHKRMKSLFSARTFLCSVQTKPVTKTGFNLVPNFMIKNSRLALNYFSCFISCINFGHFLLLHPSAAALFFAVLFTSRNCTHRFYLLAAQENLIRAERKAKHERIIISRFDDFCEGHSRRVSRVFVSECTFQHFIYSRRRLCLPIRTYFPSHLDWKYLLCSLSFVQFVPRGDYAGARCQKNLTRRTPLNDSFNTFNF